jgi:hypothetical protein
LPDIDDFRIVSGTLAERDTERGTASSEKKFYQAKQLITP